MAGADYLGASPTAATLHALQVSPGRCCRPAAGAARPPAAVADCFANDAVRALVDFAPAPARGEAAGAPTNMGAGEAPTERQPVFRRLESHRQPMLARSGTTQGL